MRLPKLVVLAFCVALLVFASHTVLAQQMPNPYGPNINLATAKKAAAAAATEATTMKVNVVITIVDTGGHLVYLERFDVVQYGSLDAALHKAKCSIAYKRPTKSFEAVIGGGNTAYLTLDGIIAIEGGVPIIQDGKIIGAIGVSGGSAQQDGVIATAGANAVK